MSYRETFGDRILRYCCPDQGVEQADIWGRFFIELSDSLLHKDGHFIFQHFDLLSEREAGRTMRRIYYQAVLGAEEPSQCIIKIGNVALSNI